VPFALQGGGLLDVLIGRLTRRRRQEAPHSATATARTQVEAAVLSHHDLAEFIRLRPDIGFHIYKNLAVGMGDKLKRLDDKLAASK
jgi:CRP-like cAMP-binding protein